MLRYSVLQYSVLQYTMLRYISAVPTVCCSVTAADVLVLLVVDLCCKAVCWHGVCGACWEHSSLPCLCVYLLPCRVGVYNDNSLLSCHPTVYINTKPFLSLSCIPGILVSFSLCRPFLCSSFSRPCILVSLTSTYSLFLVILSLYFPYISVFLFVIFLSFILSRHWILVHLFS